MPTKSERQALAFFSVITVLGVGVQLLRSDPPPVPSVPERLALEAQIAATDSAAEAKGKGKGRTKKARSPRAPRPEPTGVPSPASPGEWPTPESPPPPPAPQINIDLASAAELERLPWIGAALAARIVAEREAHGPFGSVEGLTRVRGIGPKLAARLAPMVTFSGSPRPRDGAPTGVLSRPGERLWLPGGNSPRP